MLRARFTRLIALVGLFWLPVATSTADAQPAVIRFVPAADAAPEAVGLPQPLPARDLDDALTLGELQGMALRNHPVIRESRSQVDAARSSWVQVGLRPNPEIGYAGNEIGDDGRQGMQGGFIRQKLITADKLQLNRQVETQRIFALQQRLTANRQRVLNDVRVAYFDALVAQRRVETTQELVEIGRKNVEATAKALQAMVGNRIDLLEAEVQAQTTEVVLEAAQAKHRAAWRTLAATVAVGELPALPLAGDILAELPQLAWENELARLLSESPEVAEAGARVDQAQWALQRARAERYPDFDIGAAVLKNTANGDTVATVELSLPLKIYDRNQGGIGEAAAKHRASVQARQRLELSLRQRLAEAFREYSAGRALAARYAEQVLPKANESLAMVQKAYALGEIDFLQLLTAERTVTRANLVYLDALESTWQASIEIEGMLLVDALDHP